MAFALFSRSRAAGVLLATVLSLSACGGGGGGSTPPVANPPPVTNPPPVADPPPTNPPPVAGDTTPPQVASVTPTNGATGVAPTTSVEVVYNEALKCDGVGGTVMAGSYEATVHCDGTAKKMALAFTTQLPLGAVVPAVVPGGVDVAGNKADPVSVTFTVVTPVVTSAKVYVGVIPEVDGSKAVAIIDAATGTVKHVGFQVGNGQPGFGPLYANVADPLTGKVYFAPRGGYQIYVLDLVTDAVLAPIRLDPTLTVSHFVWDLVLTETEVCAVMSASVPLGVSQNRLQCLDRWTNEVTYSGANDMLAADDMFTTRLKYVAAPTKKLYALNALRTTVLAGLGGSGGFPVPGTPGTLVALDPVSHTVAKTYAVGSVPVEFDVDPGNGDVWVVNAGDKTVSIVHPSTGQVETWTPPAPRFADSSQRPWGIVLDPDKDRVYITDSASLVVVYELSTRRELTLVNLGLGTFPGRLMIRGDELWIACNGGMIAIVDRDTLVVDKMIAVGAYPNAFASYAPGNAQ